MFTKDTPIERIALELFFGGDTIVSFRLAQGTFFFALFLFPTEMPVEVERRRHQPGIKGRKCAGATQALPTQTVVKGAWDYVSVQSWGNRRCL